GSWPTPASRRPFPSELGGARQGFPGCYRWPLVRSINGGQMHTRTAFDVDALRAEFPALRREQDGRKVAFLDGPGGTQVPQRVIDAVTTYLTDTNANHGGAFATSEASDAMAEEAHAAVADLLGAAHPDEIKFGYNMSTLTLHIGRSIGATLSPGDEIVVTTL